MEKRPTIRPKLTTTDKLLEAVACCGLLLTWILVLISYSGLPETIPTHFDSNGEIDGFGGRATILLLPAISTLLFIGMTTLNRFPHVFNYTVPITEENAPRQYANATRMVRWVKLSTTLILGLLTLKTILIAKGETGDLGFWFMFFVSTVTIVPAIYFIVKSYRMR